MAQGTYQIVRIGCPNDYAFQEFDEALFPGIQNLNDFPGTGTVAMSQESGVFP